VGASGVLRTLEGGLLAFWCPGCKEQHAVSQRWTFNGNYDKPTFSPSILTTSGHYCPSFKPGDECWCDYNREHGEDRESFACSRCHSFVTDGQIIFLGDCTHSLAGRTVSLEAF
jgi:hypothetical protein